ncbi:MAG: hypothetical protein JW908_12430 [Anaerolineales bacterium]|nr:hypothetical protein [Anaerolineales bacterium]
MDKEGFRKYLMARNANEAQIEQSFRIVEAMELFQKQHGDTGQSISVELFNAFSEQLMNRGENSLENYLALARYGRFSQNRNLFLLALDILDGYEAFDNLYTKVADEIGTEKRDMVFQGITMPVMGTPHEKKAVAMQAAMHNLEAALGRQSCIKILANGLRDLPDANYLGEKSKYEECGNIDAYLKRKGDDFIAELTQIKESQGFFFNQEITDEVIAFIERTPEIRQGVRVGNIIYEAKIPYRAKEYLAETDPIKKRFLACHCPWARSSLKHGPSNMTPIFCNCSAAFHKKPYDVIFGKPLKAEVLETVLQGDMWCKFAIYLPEEAVL